jgi:hypothetical protein
MSKYNYTQGKFKPRYPSKYKGDVNKIVFRSSYELKMFKYCDLTESVIQWSSEDVIVPYKNPVTGRNHRYFVDIYLKHKTKTGIIKEKIIEVKPAKQVRPPVVRQRKTKKYLQEVQTFVINQAKWAAADKWAVKHGMDFVIFTEKQLGIHK